MNEVELSINPIQDQQTFSRETFGGCQERTAGVILNQWLQTNCTECPILSSFENLEDGLGLVRQDTGGGKASFYISDWRKLWNHFAVDPNDSFLEHFSFYANIIHFFTHGRTFRWCWYITIYHFFLAIACTAISSEYAFPIVSVLVITPSYFLLFYVWAYVIFRGPLLYRETLPPNVLQKTISTSGRQQVHVLGETFAANLKDTIGMSTSHPASVSSAATWSDAFNNMLMSLGQEMLGCIPCAPNHIAATSPLFADESTSSDVISDLGLYQLLNVTTKLALLRGSGCITTANISRKLKILALLLIISFFLMGIYTWGVIIYDANIRGCWYDVDPDIDRGLCNIRLLFNVATGFGFTTSAMTFLLGSAANLLLLGAGYATIMCLQLSTSWISRFEPLRLLRVDSSEDEEALDEGARDVKDTARFRWSTFAALVERDAIESYLFQFSFMQYVGDRLNSLFAMAFIFAVATIITQIFNTINSDHPQDAFVKEISVLTYTTIFVVTFLYAFPIWCMARANSSVDLMVNMVVASGVNDFGIIGGREMWIQFFTENPCFWRLFGYPLTFNALGVAVISVVLPICYFLLPPESITEFMSGSSTGNTSS